MCIQTQDEMSFVLKQKYSQASLLLKEFIFYVKTLEKCFFIIALSSLNWCIIFLPCMQNQSQIINSLELHRLP